MPCVISVVIAWVNPPELLEQGLDSLTRQQSRNADEIIVVTRHNQDMQMRLRARYPEVTLLSASPQTPITMLRSMGLRVARGTIAIVTEDHCVPSGDWISVVEQRLQEDCDVVGGPVENACTHRLRDWAAFLTEYAFAIRSHADVAESTIKPAAELPGNNVAYKREFVAGLCATLESGLWESFYHRQLAGRGAKMFLDTKMLLYHRRPFDFRYFIAQRYHFCRSFAAMRCQSLKTRARIKYGLGSVLLPPLLWMRGFRTLARKRRLVGRYICCSPLIAIYLSAGALGEMIGYFFDGGRSLERVE